MAAGEGLPPFRRADNRPDTRPGVGPPGAGWGWRSLAPDLPPQWESAVLKKKPTTNQNNNTYLTAHTYKVRRSQHARTHEHTTHTQHTHAQHRPSQSLTHTHLGAFPWADRNKTAIQRPATPIPISRLWERWTSCGQAKEGGGASHWLVGVGSHPAQPPLRQTPWALGRGAWLTGAVEGVTRFQKGGQGDLEGEVGSEGDAVEARSDGHRVVRRRDTEQQVPVPRRQHPGAESEGGTVCV